MNRKKKITLILIIALFIIIIALFPSIKRAFAPGDGGKRVEGAPAGSVRRALNVNAMIMGYENLEDKANIVGILFPDEEVDLAFEISGMITDIYFREGSYVREGELLAKVNDKPLQAELRKLEAQLPLAQNRVSRQQQLLARQAVSQESVESVNTELEKLKADIEYTKARIAQTELRAPFDGLIGFRNVSEGAYASPSVVISRLAKIDPLKLQFSLNQHEAGLVEPGQTVEYTLGDETYTATIYAVEPIVERGTLTRAARAIVPNPGGRIQPGRSVSTLFNLRDMKDALLIPAISMVAEMGQDVVYVYRGGVAVQTPVTKGMRTASSVQIVQGLHKGDTLITSGVMQLRNGMEVIINNLDGSMQAQETE